MKKLGSSAVSIAVVCVILLIIIPMPKGILDVLLILNLSLALTVLLFSMTIRKALEFSILPSLLLLTTLFRLSLEISATRLILTKSGDAGAVIRTFGNFVCQGSVGVGIVIFLIIVVVQFIVITKGAERVAEVAARFTLDAMPGKQMAIDADLNTGLIDEREAKRRRSEIQREADFFGAMDGASKFVKGDAIVAIVIMVVNMIGGMAIGLYGGDDISSVLSTYTLATIGEGLMAQLPALLISTATGIVVTRTAAEDNLNNELLRQLRAEPRVLQITGVVLLAMMLIPGFPVPTLIVLGLLFLFLGYEAGRVKNRGAPQAEKPAAAPRARELSRDPKQVYSLLEVEPLEMEFGYSLLPLVDETQGGTLIDRVVLFRRQFALETGVVFPSVRMRDNIELKNNQYVIRLRGEQVAQGEILPDHFLLMGGENGLPKNTPGIDVTEPAFGLPARWIVKEQRQPAEVNGYSVIDPTSVMMTHLGEVIRAHAAELLGRAEVNALLDLTRKRNASLVDETVPQKVTVGTLERVLQNLLREQVPVRDMERILETLCEHAPAVKDPDLLTEFVRQGLRRTISRRFAPEGSLRALILDPQAEKLIAAAVRQTDRGVVLALDPQKAQSLLDHLGRQMEKVSATGSDPVLVVSPAVRPYVCKLAESLLPRLTVLSYGELLPDVRVRAVGAVAA